MSYIPYVVEKTGRGEAERGHPVDGRRGGEQAGNAADAPPWVPGLCGRALPRHGRTARGFPVLAVPHDGR